MDEARVGCAIERFRLQQGRFPQSLAEAESNLPHDVITGEPLKYRCEPQNYTLYSVGWNEVDDGGKVAIKSGMKEKREDEQGDWVWFGRPVP